ncbi:MAG: glycosyltransferase, partial [Candidatus Lokiarchaeota archaeon]|nr:glycosyltransferase [Candidatus Lokiarchaeota archaeon]MBD3200825.1 glycosyltransferase [Candidatus Lokiarchaeota archaeon]
MNPKVSVIILNYNHVDNVINCLNSLSLQTYNDFEVILIDNGSKEEIYAELREKLIKFREKLDIRLIRKLRNLYFGAGNNLALKKVSSDYICLLNYDTIVKENFIEEMVNFLDNNPDAGMITPKIKIYDDKDIIWNAGA